MPEIRLYGGPRSGETFDVPASLQVLYVPAFEDIRSSAVVLSEDTPPVSTSYIRRHVYRRHWQWGHPTPHFNYDGVR